MIGLARASVSGRPTLNAALDFAREASLRRRPAIREPFVIGAVIDLGLMPDLTSASGIHLVRAAYADLVHGPRKGALKLPQNSPDGLRRKLDCAVIRNVHRMIEEQHDVTIDTVRGVFIEGAPIYPTAGFYEKIHVQIAVRNLASIKVVFRVSLAGLK